MCIQLPENEEMVLMVKEEGGGYFLHPRQITKRQGCISLGNKMILNAIIKNKRVTFIK